MILTQEYYDILEAPHKGIVWFEYSGHNPWITEVDEFVRAVVEKMLEKSVKRNPTLSIIT